MPDVNDIALLREYVDNHSESAFAEIVHRHINLVYSVALRYTGNSSDAQDVTQAVFIILAQKAARLGQRATLTGWLYEATRFTAMNFLTSKTRRQSREQKACMHSTPDDSNSENVWRQLAPLLEAAMTRLSEKERTLVALRFFENKSVAETAALLGIQEWAARKRAARAMEKLRQFFLKRGIASTTATLAATISANSIQPAPAVLAKTATTAALTKGATTSGPTLTLVKGALKIMAWTKAKTALVTSVAVILAAGTTTTLIVKHRNQPFRPATSAQGGILKESWTLAGFATPEDAFQSWLWTMNKGNSDALLTTFAPELRQQIQKAEENDPGVRKKILFKMSQTAKMQSYSITQTNIISENEVVLRVVFHNDNGDQESNWMMRKYGDEWKFLGGRK